MAIRERIRRALRKSDSSGSDSSSRAGGTSSTNTTAATATTAATSETSSLRKTQTAATSSSAFSRVFNTLGGVRRGRDRDRDRDDGRRRDRRDRRRHRKPVHPSQRPLTLQNLRHQEMLSHFTMTFGASDPSQIESLSFCGVSPCCTRAPSVDLDLAALSVAESPTGAEPAAPGRQ